MANYHQFENETKLKLETLLKNIDSFRYVLSYYNKDSLRKYLVSLLYEIEYKIKTESDELKTWKIEHEIKYLEIHCYPTSSWDVRVNRQNTNVYIYVSLNNMLEPQISDPEIGLYLPDPWNKADQFSEYLLKSLQPGFKKDWTGKGENDRFYPLRNYVELSNTKSIKELMQNITQNVYKLIEIKKKVDQAIKKSVE
jgi:hypothetical protein